jgi:hypothetical protein
MVENRGAFRVLVGKPEGKRPNGNSRKLDDNIKMGLQDVECGGVDWIDLAHDGNMWLALLNVLMNCRVI